MEKKDFARTIRMKESIRLYVEKQAGETFSEKFENMVRFCMEQESKTTARLIELQKQIAAENKKLAKYRDLLTKLDNIKWRVDQALNDAEKLSQ